MLSIFFNTSATGITESKKESSLPERKEIELPCEKSLEKMNICSNPRRDAPQSHTTDETETEKASITEWYDRMQSKKSEKRHITSLNRMDSQAPQRGSRMVRHLSEEQVQALYEKEDRKHSWLKSLQQLDPRFQILMYFDEIARQGGALEDPLAPPPKYADLLRGFSKSTAFTVWRPTSREAIYKMMRGDATGKGLECKGKSAKIGKLSGLVPFLQIHKNEHKKLLRSSPSDGRIRLYFNSDITRDLAFKKIKSIASAMRTTVVKAKETLERSYIEKDRVEAMTNVTLDVDDWNIYKLDKCGFGLDVAERVIVEAFISQQDISRGEGYETGRPSEPAFQDMNFQSARKYSGTGPRLVVYQTCESKTVLRPDTLVLAYEEDGNVTPVSSDFDCFTVATRGVAYDVPMAEDQIELTKWLIKKIETVLEKPGGSSWTSRWLEVLKESANEGFYPKVPRFGFGDPKSYSIIEGAVARFVQKKNGAVRHGAECFNYYFPQEIDEKFLVISDTLPGKLPWKYVDVDELQQMLREKVDDDFCFPINPKWILSDNGWKEIYDKMLLSTNVNTQKSMETWYPKDSGIREMIQAVHKRFPKGFVQDESCRTFEDRQGSEAMDLASEELRRHIVIRRAKAKLRAFLVFNALYEDILALKHPTRPSGFCFCGKFLNLLK